MSADLRLDLGEGDEVRSYTPRDLHAIWDLVEGNRERLRRWLPWVEVVRTIEDERSWLAEVLAGPRALEGLGIWHAEALAGGIGLTVDRLNDCADIGYWLGQGFEGRGLVTRACRSLVEHGFDRLGLHRVTIRCAVDNTRSRAVPERLGFHREAVLREAGKTGEGYEDLVVYAMLATDRRSA